MTVQRRRGQVVKVWKTETLTDRRGNTVQASEGVDSPPVLVRAAFIPQRSSRAEVPGQQSINIYRMIIDADLEGVGLWSRIEWRGAIWDPITPPEYHQGTRQTRHWSIDIRERPAGKLPWLLGD